MPTSKNSIEVKNVHPLIAQALKSFLVQVKIDSQPVKYPLAIIRAGRKEGFFKRGQ